MCAAQLNFCLTKQPSTSTIDNGDKLSEQDKQYQRFMNMLPVPVPGPKKPRGPVEIPKEIVVAANPVKDAEGNDHLHLYEFHSREKITSWINESALANSDCDEREDGSQFSPITRMVINIDGVAEIRLEPYKMTVRKAVLYKWDEIAPKIVGILKYWNYTQRALRENLVVTPGQEPQRLGREILRLPPGTGLKELGLLGGTSESNVA